MIFKSDGGEILGVLSIAPVRPCPKVLDRDTNGVMDAASAAFVMNERREFVIVIVLLFLKIGLNKKLESSGTPNPLDASY